LLVAAAGQTTVLLVAVQAMAVKVAVAVVHLNKPPQVQVVLDIMLVVTDLLVVAYQAVQAVLTLVAAQVATLGQSQEGPTAVLA
jgi:hypothetical protein|tara:strand:- start:145 stop:396 length:252 start_codon:yes stop_codon:yes gene_type:complete